jgi:ABC-type Fe3+/spermidine/putrescine transport system ATPase subunit
MIEQNGTPATVYRYPSSPFVARFLGLTNLIEAHQVAPSSNGVVAQTTLGPLMVKDISPENVARFLPVAHNPTEHSDPSTPLFVLIRPEAAQAAQPSAANVVEGEVVHTTFRGGTQRIVLRHGSGTLLELDVATNAHDGQYVVGQPALVALRPHALTLVRSGNSTT